MTQYEHVFSPFRFGGVELKNRIATSPMLACLATPDGYVTREMIDFYQAFARGGAGLVNIGDSGVDGEFSLGHYLQINLGHDSIIGGLSTLVEAIQKHGAVASLEINHTGMLGKPSVLGGKNPIGPSPAVIRRETGEVQPEMDRVITVTEMDQDLIDRVVANFAAACQRCLQAGFRTVMLHGAHGNLLAQFASPLTNKRTDEYGGSLENRARFALEVLEAIRAKVGDRLALEYRVSGDEIAAGGMHLEETVEFLRLLGNRIDLVNVSVGGIFDPACLVSMAQPTYLPRSFNVPRAEAIKKALDVPVVAVGSIRDLATAEEIIAAGKADLVAMGRAHLADPEIVNKTRHGRADDVRPCLRCNLCGERPARFFPVRCAVNPVTGRETEYRSLGPAEKQKTVVVVGGGPAGMQAALTASSRGHRVTLFERRGSLGGSLRYAAAPEFKGDMREYLDWLIRQTRRSPADIRLEAEATSAAIAALKPDVLILALGAEPLIPALPGIGGKNVVWAGDVDAGTTETGNTVVVAGAGLTGCETALHLAQQGKAVTLIDLLPEGKIAQDASAASRMALLDLLDRHGVQFRTEVTLTEITPTSAVVTGEAGDRIEIPADTVVLALGMRPLSAEARSLEGLAPDTYTIGDCRTPRDLMAAIHEAFNLTAEL
jgi:2,4-dienoyl-CoA reductase-like NADH-dependent reductase (Old Yellow Enzyme family)/thioredoxin reductase